MTIVNLDRLMILHVVRGYWIPLKVEAFAGLGFIGHTDRSFQVKIRLMCLVCVFLVNLILVDFHVKKERSYFPIIVLFLYAYLFHQYLL